MILNTNSDMSSLATFLDDSVACFTQDAEGKLCGAIALSTFSALLLLFAHAALGYQRCRQRVESGGEAMSSLYSLLGNICSTIGAIFSRQLHLQVIFGAFSATMDAVGFMTICIPICFCWNSNAEKKLRARRRRRRQLLAVCVLMVLAGGFLRNGLSESEIDRRPLQRRLLQVIMEDNSILLGYVLGMLSFAILYTSRLPAFYKAYKEPMVTRVQIFSGVLSSFSGVCYASAILLYDHSNVFIWRTMPWLLSAVLCAIMDLLVVVIHLCKRKSSIQRPVVLSPDTEHLLKNPVSTVEEKPREQKIHSTQQVIDKNAEKATGVGHYFDVTVPPERKWPDEITLSKMEKKEGVPVNHTVQERPGDSLSSSDTSFDSSVTSSDLEWDFEEANIHWCEPTAKQNGEKFPLQEWKSISLLTEH